VVNIRKAHTKPSKREAASLSFSFTLSIYTSYTASRGAVRATHCTIQYKQTHYKNHNKI